MVSINDYNYAGSHLAAAGGIFDPQHNNVGMLELDIDDRVPGASKRLQLALAKFEVPPRNVGHASLGYLNGQSNYTTRAQPMEKIQVTFRDFVNNESNIRADLHRLFNFTFDEKSGLMSPASVVKTNGFAVLLGVDGESERSYTLEGIALVKSPNISVDMDGSGEIILIDCEFIVDRVIPDNSLLSPRSNTDDIFSLDAAGGVTGPVF